LLLKFGYKGLMGTDVSSEMKAVRQDEDSRFAEAGRCMGRTKRRLNYGVPVKMDPTFIQLLRSVPDRSFKENNTWSMFQ
jgi:hypothetical protein